MSSKRRGFGSTCSVPFCTMKRGTNLLSEVKMYSFPRDPKRCLKWRIAVRRKNWTPNKNSLICNAHFVTGKPSNDPSHPDYVPNVFVFSKPKTDVIGFKRRQRCPKLGVNTDGAVLSDMSLNYETNKSLRPKLKPSAIPSLLLPGMSTSVSEKNNLNERKLVKKSALNKEVNRDIQYIKCFVSGCQSKCPKETGNSIAVGEKIIHMFPAPRSDTLFFKWKEVLQIEAKRRGREIEREFSREDHVCELHFHEKEIERFFITKTSDGSVIEIEKREPTLKSRAFPTMFVEETVDERTGLFKPNPIKNSEQTIEKNKLDDTSSSDSSSKNSDDNLSVVFDSFNNSAVDSKQEKLSHQKYLVKKSFSYEEIVKNIQHIKRPSAPWSVVCTEKFTLFARWNDKFVAEKRLVIENNLCFRVFLNDWEMNITDFIDINTLDDITSLLKKVDSY